MIYIAYVVTEASISLYHCRIISTYIDRADLHVRVDYSYDLHGYFKVVMNTPMSATLVVGVILILSIVRTQSAGYL